MAVGGGSLFMRGWKRADDIYLSTKKGEWFITTPIRYCLLDSDIAKLTERRAKRHAQENKYKYKH